MNKMAGVCSFWILVSLVSLSVVLSTVNCLITGAPDRSCKDPSTFHTRKINATHEGIILPRNMSNNPYYLDVNATTFTPGAKIKVTLHGGTAKTPFKGFFIQAVQANVGLRNFRREAYGTFTNVSLDERPSACEPMNTIARGGITHTNNNTKYSSSAVWIAPKSYNPGSVQFLATAVKDYNTYWTDVRSPVLVPNGFQTTVPDTSNAAFDHWTATAAWYQWLHSLQMQQQQNMHMGPGHAMP